MNTILSTLSVSLLICWLYPLYNRFRTDRMRDELFAVRDELFDMARNGEISFDSRSYVATRMIINGMIRFAHKAGVLRFLLIIWFGSTRLSNHYKNEIQDAFDASSQKDRELCARFIFEANKICARHFASSIFGSLLILPFIIRSIAKRSRDAVSDVVNVKRHAFDALDREAYAEGRPCPAVP